MSSMTIMGRAFLVLALTANVVSPARSQAPAPAPAPPLLNTGQPVLPAPPLLNTGRPVLPAAPVLSPAAVIPGLDPRLAPVTGAFTSTPGFFPSTFTGGVGFFPGFPLVSPFFSPVVTTTPFIPSILPGGFIQRPNVGMLAMQRIQPPPPARRQLSRNQLIIIDGPGAATRAAPLATPEDPPGNFAVGRRAVSAALAVTPVPRRVARNTGTSKARTPTFALALRQVERARAPEAPVATVTERRIARRMALLMNRHALVPGRVVRVGKTAVRVTVAGPRSARIRSYPLAQVFFYRGERLRDAAVAGRNLRRGDRVMVPEGVGWAA